MSRCVPVTNEVVATTVAESVVTNIVTITVSRAWEEKRRQPSGS